MIFKASFECIPRLLGSYIHCCRVDDVRHFPLVVQAIFTNYYFFFGGGGAKFSLWGQCPLPLADNGLVCPEVPREWVLPNVACGVDSWT